MAPGPVRVPTANDAVLDLRKEYPRAEGALKHTHAHTHRDSVFVLSSRLPSEAAQQITIYQRENIFGLSPPIFLLLLSAIDFFPFLLFSIYSCRISSCRKCGNIEQLEEKSDAVVVIQVRQEIR